MSNKHSTYAAVLFRGWEYVRLYYSLTGDAVVVRRKSTWSLGPPAETAVPLADLSGQVSHTIARQSAHFPALALFILIGLLLAADLLLFHATPQPGGAPGLYWPLWAPALALGTLAWWIMWQTRKPLAWTHFHPHPGRPGLYVLRNPRAPEAHAHFIAAVSRKLPKG